MLRFSALCDWHRLLSLMASARPRSPSSSDESRAAKRVRTDGPARDVVADFHTGLLDPKNAAQLHTEYATSGPYLHAVIDKLFDDSLLRAASEEIIRELHFTEKETDIYKVCKPVARAKVDLLGLSHARWDPGLYFRILPLLPSPDCIPCNVGNSLWIEL